MGIIEFLFIPLWPFGIVVPIVFTIVLYYANRNLIKIVPFVSTAIWLIVRVILIWDVLIGALFPERRIQNELDFSIEPLILAGTAGLTIIVLVLSLLSTWITHKILKKVVQD